MTSAVNPPTVYVVAGPNGAGKTTFACEFLPQFADCREFLNADLIASGLSPFAPESQNLRAGRLLLQRFDELAGLRRSFGFETTLSGRAYARRFHRLQESGYRIELSFLWLPSADVAVNRVAIRVSQGGHNVPEQDVRRRYDAGMRNLFQLYLPIVDSWRFYDASMMPPTVIATEFDGTLNLQQKVRFETIKSSFQE